MTREEAIKALKWFKKYNEEDYCGSDRIQDEIGNWYYLISEKDFEAFELAIKALEQDESFAKKAEIVISQLRTDRDKLSKIINTIRAEIQDTGAYEQEINGKTEFLKGINYCLNVIDTYIAESED